MNMADKYTIVKYVFEGDKFEILVKPDPALDYKLGKTNNIGPILVSDEIYTDSSKGTRSSSEKLIKAFKTEDPLVIAEKIMQKGVLNLTTDQRRKMISEKRKQIITFIAVLKSTGILKKEDWQSNGSLKAILEIPAASRPNVLDRLGAVTKGTAFVEVVK